MNARPIQMIDDMVGVLRDEYHIDVLSRSRKESVVIPRAALFNVCRGYYSATLLADYFGKNHATILHHFKNHQNLMMVPDYRQFFSVLTDVSLKYDLAPISVRTDTIDEILALRRENRILKEKLKSYEGINS